MHMLYPVDMEQEKGKPCNGTDEIVPGRWCASALPKQGHQVQGQDRVYLPRHHLKPCHIPKYTVNGMKR